ncbi:MAG: 30S ribosomal protein S12 methylthiotransferase RimO [Phycisphaerae bacterium]|nr:30S ribosomal protein S12 methylthiotransferase RimO [Phycisphaerae bacterium]
MTKSQTSVAIVSLGCPKNLVDSEKMLADLAEAGCIVGAPTDDADVILINTCGFLAAAREEALDIITQSVDLKETSRVSRVVVAGCLPTRDGAQLYDAAPGIDAVVGVNDREEIVNAVIGTGRFTKLTANPLPFAAPESKNQKVAPGDAGRFRLTPRHTGYLRIAEGCDQKCTFCTIPAIRGPMRSKPAEMILAEARELIADGVVEMNIIAQDTTAYGGDINTNLASLLRQLNALDGAQWLRLMYTYPRGFDDALIDAIVECDCVLPYLDMPLQHISDGILKRMNRRITRDTTVALLEKLRDRIDGLIIRTSFIVGFPGETQQQFDELLDFVCDFQFDNLGVFEYSPEPGTPAAKMNDQVPADVAAERAAQIMAAQQDIAITANESLVGAELEVLVDGVDESGATGTAGASIGRFYGQAPDIDGVCILTEPCEVGTIVQGTIVAAQDYDLVVQPQGA